jgi:uncharacterized membrane protein YfcA
MIKLAISKREAVLYVGANGIENALTGGVLGGVAGSAHHLWKHRKDKEERKKIGKGFAQGAAMGSIAGAGVGSLRGARMAIKRASFTTPQKLYGYARNMSEDSMDGALYGGVLGGLAGSAHHVWKNRKDKDERKKIGKGFAQGAAIGTLTGGGVMGALSANETRKIIKARS